MAVLINKAMIEIPPKFAGRAPVGPIPPGEKHWHGASPTNSMTHIAMQEALEGNYATWMEHVTDADYAAKVG